MPIATPEIYADMLDRAKAGAFAYPAINVSSSSTLIAALRGFAEAESDGIIQFSWGGAEYASGSTVKNMVDGAVGLAEFAHVVAKNYNVNIALHTDHCPAEKLDGFMRPLLEFGANRIKNGQSPLFSSHMWDGSAVDMPTNMKIAAEMQKLSAAARTILEIEIGVVGGEEDGIEAKHDAKLYSTPEDALMTIETLGDATQSDLVKTSEKNGIVDFMSVLRKMDSFDIIEFGVDDIVRSGLVRQYLIAKIEEGF